jgi:hypothetical protein
MTMSDSWNSRAIRDLRDTAGIPEPVEYEDVTAECNLPVFVAERRPDYVSACIEETDRRHKTTPSGAVCAEIDEGPTERMEVERA